MTRFAIFRGSTFGIIKKSESIFELLKTLKDFDCIKWRNEEGHIITLDWDTFKFFQENGKTIDECILFAIADSLEYGEEEEISCFKSGKIVSL